MLRGFLSGVFWGLVVSVVVLAGASVLGHLPDKPVSAGTPEVEVPAGSSFNRDAPEGPAALPATDKNIATTQAPVVAQPKAEAPYAPNADTATPAQPEAGALPQSTGPAPQPSDAPGAVAIGGESPVLPNPQSMAPKAPGADSAPSASAATLPPAPQSPPAKPAPEAGAPAPATPSAAPSVAPSQAQAPGPAPDAPQLPQTLQIGQAGNADVAGVTTDRLPRIGDLPPAEAAAPARKIPWIEAFAAPFSNPDAKPLMSIVLINAKPRPTPRQLAEFPFPVTFAVDPAQPDAGEAMALYRRAGFEVAMLVTLPAEMTAKDAEVNFEIYKRVLPEAVALMDAKDSAAQTNRALLGEVMAILKDSGMGLVSYPQGLNTALQIAQRQGVPAQPVFRSFDSNGETPVVMRRFLDQAAFRAGQENGVIVVGHARAQTIQTLVEWGVQGRATTVALAPLSAVLTLGPR